nr:carbon storage regulator CsrA [Tumebacillus amylolyticus]
MVLKRKVGESIMIGEDVELIVLEKEGDTVKIGIHAPRTIRVFRKELYEEIRQANQRAFASTLPPMADLQKMWQKKSKIDEN